MNTRILMPIDDYLHTSFDGPDRDYVDGEAIERNTGELPHAVVQTEVAYMLQSLASSLGLRVLPELADHLLTTNHVIAETITLTRKAYADRLEEMYSGPQVLEVPLYSVFEASRYLQITSSGERRVFLGVPLSRETYASRGSSRTSSRTVMSNALATSSMRAKLVD